MEGYVGRGGTGPGSTPECPVCFAKGNGGHGGLCPNMDRKPEDYTDVLPAGFSKPRKD
jgi:hypothetical protein